MTLHLNRETARAILVAAQGLAHPRSQLPSRDYVLETIRQISALQIDTINVVARSPYLILWSRLGDFPTGWLDDLLVDKQVFEYWSHAACFLPAEDYPYYRSLMLAGWHRHRYSESWLEKNSQVISGVLERIRQEGPLRSADFESDHKPAGGWWNWKEEKNALEYLFTTGELMISRRHHFQRVYDLRQRIRPDWDDATAPSLEETLRALTLKAIKALGVGTATWTANYFYLPKVETARCLEALGQQNLLLPVSIEGIKEPAYLHPDQFDQVKLAEAGELQSFLTTLLSPFDPLITDRQRTRTLFDFNYSIECYLPASKRHYGYYTLPILHRGTLVGRLDPKAHRKDGIFEVKTLYLEAGVKLDGTLIEDLAKAVQDCAAWHQTPQVIVRYSEPKELAEALNDRLCGSATPF